MVGGTLEVPLKLSACFCGVVFHVSIIHYSGILENIRIDLAEGGGAGVEFEFEDELTPVGE